MKFLAVFLLCLVCLCHASARNRPEICDLPPEKGFCRALIESYFFNKTSATCELFYYGGCGGNENNFDTKQECIKKCM